MDLKADRPDFLSEVLKQNGENGMKVEEIVKTSPVTIVTDIETTASNLLGITDYLVKNPDAMAKLVKGIR